MKTKILLSVYMTMAGYGMAAAQNGAPYIEFYTPEPYVEPVETVGPQLLRVNTDDDELRPLRYNPYRDEISIRMTLWTRADMLHSPARDLLALAGLSPSASLRGDGTVSIWGSEQAPLILVDGVKIRGTAGLPMGAVYSMEVLTGNIPACWGDTPGGVINITTLPGLR